MAKEIEVEIDWMRYHLIDNHACRTVATLRIGLVSVLRVLWTKPIPRSAGLATRPASKKRLQIPIMVPLSNDDERDFRLETRISTSG